MSKFSPEPNTGCWLWLASGTQDGYGHIVDSDGKLRRASRISFELFVGPIPPTMFVCHRCDTPLCVNPEHLFLGTPVDNVADMMKKGRHKAVVGAAHPSAKLTNENVLAIRASSKPSRKLALEFGIGPSQVKRIWHGESWDSLRFDQPPRPRIIRSKSIKKPKTGKKGEFNGRSKLTQKNVLHIRNSSKGPAELSKHFGVSKSLIAQIKRRSIWTHI